MVASNDRGGRNWRIKITDPIPENHAVLMQVNFEMLDARQ